MSSERLLDSLIELQMLDRIPRTGFLQRGVVEPESVAEHSFQLALLVWAVLRREPPGGPWRLEHALELALLHDIAEVRTGDIPRSANSALPREAKKKAELKIFLELLEPTGDDAAELAQELVTATSPEARLVKACDRLQLLIKAHVYESQGYLGASEFWSTAERAAPEEFEDGGSRVVRELFDTLRKRRLG